MKTVEMVFQNTMEAASYIADTIFSSRAPSVEVQLVSRPMSFEQITEFIFERRPELLLCVESISMRSECLCLWIKMSFSVSYTDVMPSAVTEVTQVGEALDAMLRDVQLHRRSSELIFLSGIEQEILTAVSNVTELPRFLDCFLKGTSVTVKRRPGCSYSALSVNYIYSCSYAEYRQRQREMELAVNKIVRLSKAAGVEDWKKALLAVRYFVENWKYGADRSAPGVEFTAYGALVKHTAVCMGISLATCVVFTRLGIPCRYIRGARAGEGHAWNLVYLQGGWFYIDVTDAISHRDPLYHWGMTSLTDRITTEPVGVQLKCTCPTAFLRGRGKI